MQIRRWHNLVGEPIVTFLAEELATLNEKDGGQIEKDSDIKAAGVELVEEEEKKQQPHLEGKTYCFFWHWSMVPFPQPYFQL